MKKNNNDIINNYYSKGKYSTSSTLNNSSRTETTNAFKLSNNSSISKLAESISGDSLSSTLDFTKISSIQKLAESISSNSPSNILDFTKNSFIQKLAESISGDSLSSTLDFTKISSIQKLAESISGNSLSKILDFTKISSISNLGKFIIGTYSSDSVGSIEKSSIIDALVDLSPIKNTLIHEDQLDEYILPTSDNPTSVTESTTSRYNTTNNNNTYNINLNVNSTKEDIKQKKSFDDYIELVLKIINIITLIVSLCTPKNELINKYNISTESTSPKKVVNELKYNINSDTSINSINFEMTRYVNSRILYVRENPKDKSLIIDKLYAGEIVVIIERYKKWSFVSYKDNSNNMLCGYVLNKYLKHVNQKKC